jgi:hypothetical protein
MVMCAQSFTWLAALSRPRIQEYVRAATQQRQSASHRKPESSTMRNCATALFLLTSRFDLEHYVSK